MALIQVTADTPAQILTANRDLTVTVDLTAGGGGSSDFVVYCYILRAGLVVGGRKVPGNEIVSFDLLKNDTVRVWAGGSGFIQVTTH
jgi:hypothetical protein